MNISEKLAIQFITKHFHHFDDTLLDTKLTAGVYLKSTDLPRCTTLTSGVTVFRYSGYKFLVYLPEILNPGSASKKSMLNKVKNRNISFGDDPYNWNWYLVTQNRLDVLEEIMHNSGMIDANSSYRFDKNDIVQHDSADRDICVFAQDGLSLLDGFKNGDRAYFYASDVEALCKNIDILYSKMLREKDELLCSIDPKTVEWNAKVIELAAKLLPSVMETMNKQFDRLAAMLKQK